MADPEALKVNSKFKVFVQLNRMHLSSEAQTFTEAIAPCTASVSFQMIDIEIIRFFFRNSNLPFSAKTRSIAYFAYVRSIRRPIGSGSNQSF